MNSQYTVNCPQGQVVCPECNGKGYIHHQDGFPCWKCNGSGCVAEEKDKKNRLTKDGRPGQMKCLPIAARNWHHICGEFLSKPVKCHLLSSNGTNSTQQSKCRRITTFSFIEIGGVCGVTLALKVTLLAHNCLILGRLGLVLGLTRLF